MGVQDGWHGQYGAACACAPCAGQGEAVMRPVALLLAGAALLAPVAMALAQDASGNRPSPLPGGASSLNESYEDWQVLCGSQEGKAVCNLTQTQTQQASGQRVLDIRLNPASEDGIVRGVLTLPFGLALDRGVVFQVDESEPAAPLGFSTCLPAGCIVPVAVDKALLAAMRGGAALKLATVAVQGQATPFSISLKGFAKAFDRAAEIAK